MKKRMVKRAARRKPDIFGALLAAVSAKYQNDGDKTKAGVVVACIGHDPLRFYASIARYPYGPDCKQIVVSTRGLEIETAAEAIELLARRWWELARPVPIAADALASLGRTLGHRIGLR